MTAPFIYIGTHTVKPGRLEQFQTWFADYIAATIEPNEPRLLSFAAYSHPDNNQVTIVQVHPDAESMVHHMKVITEHVAVAYTDFLEPGGSFDVYGTPSSGVLEKIATLGGTSEPPTAQRPFAGFTRLRTLAPEA
jgi:quinol monooxygenase YgiN